jgi:hypothetical protein
MSYSRSRGLISVLTGSVVFTAALLAAPSVSAQAFGQAVAAGNFNGSGWSSTRDEMAIGAPWDSVFATRDGSVTIYWRNGNGAWLYDYLDQDVLNFGPFSGASDGGAETDDRFGNTLAVGDFDADGFTDLVIAAPYDDVNGKVDAGCVHVLYGAATGPWGMPFRATTTFLTRGSAFNYTKVPNLPGANDNFGMSLAVGDFNKDGKDDLAVGAPGVTIDGKPNAGAVFVFPSNGTWFSTAFEVTLFQGGPDSPAGVAEANDYFGSAIAFGNFNGDLATNGKPLLDIAVSAPGQKVGNAVGAGNVTIYYNDPINGDFNNATNQVITQADTGSNDPVEANDGFGSSLAAANLNAFNQSPAMYLDDLAIGVPYETRGGLAGAGAVHILYGATTGLSSSGSSYLLPSTFSTQNTATQANSYFGFSLATGEFVSDPNGGCQGQACNPKDLVIGEWGRNVNGFNVSGKTYFAKGRSNATVSPVAAYDGFFNAGAGYSYGLAVGQIQATGGAQPDAGPIGDILIGEPGWNRVRVQLGGGTSITPQSQQLTFGFPW